MPVRHSNPDTIHAPAGYSHIAEVSGGRLVYTSGQVALDRDGNLVGAGDLEAQARQVFENLNAALAAAGTDFNSVVKLNYFFAGDVDISVVREVRNEYVNTASPPASTAVVVNRLVRPEWLLEVEAIAVVPD